MNMKQLFFSFSLLLLFLFHCTKTLAQPTAAPAGPTASPAPPAPPADPTVPLVTPGPTADLAPHGVTNVTKILEKGQQFSMLIRLLKSTSVIDQIEQQLNGTGDSGNSGVTIFAPTDNAFSSLSTGTLNSLTDPQKEALIQFHVISAYIPPQRFATVRNPLRTNAGNNNKYSYQLNVTSHSNSLNISTGITNTTVSGTIYSDGQLAIYRVEKVLLPWELFGAKPPASPPPALSPEEAKPKKEKPDATTDDSDNDKANASGAVSLTAMQKVVLSGVAIAATIFS